MTKLQTQGLYFEIETHGLPSNPAMLLIRGLGSQLIDWPYTLIEGLVRDGFYVVTFDNRDAGLSQKMSEPRAQNYSIQDMARDCIDILTALNITKSHVLGLSMGGMITQELLATRSQQILSATIIMSSNGDPDLPRKMTGDEIVQPPDETADEDALLSALLNSDKLWEGPKYKIPLEQRRDSVVRRYRRSHFPEGVARQFKAVEGFRKTARRFDKCETPTLTIHGSDDQIFSVEHGESIARSIPNAKFVLIDGMGHELSDVLGAHIAELVQKFVTNGSLPANIH